MTVTTLTDRELDRAIAQMRGLTVCCGECPTPNVCPCDGWYTNQGSLPHYTTDPAWMVTLLEEMVTQDWPYYLGRHAEGWRFHFLYVDNELGYSPTIGIAVARAWLAWQTAKTPADEAGVLFPRA